MNKTSSSSSYSSSSHSRYRSRSRSRSRERDRKDNKNESYDRRYRDDDHRDSRDTRRHDSSKHHDSRDSRRQRDSSKYDIKEKASSSSRDKFGDKHRSDRRESERTSSKTYPEQKILKEATNLASLQTDQNNKEENVVVDEDDLKELEAFMNGEIDEEEEEERLMRERKNRREQILAKHQPNDVAVSDVVDNKITDSNNKIISEDIIENSSSSSSSSKSIDVVPFVDREEEAFREIIAEKDAVNAEANSRLYNTTFDIFSSTPSEFENKVYGIREVDSMKVSMDENGNMYALKESLVVEGEDKHLQSNWDDQEGYYKARIGEIIQDRYRTLGVVGKGVFSTVLKCVDLQKPVIASSETAVGTNVANPNESKYEAVAIKIIRNNDTMRKAAEKELAILSLLVRNDPQNKKHCVQLLEKFEFRNHIAIVFEYKTMNLRETLKKFGKDTGINIGAIRLYTRQLFIALKHLNDLRIVHADIKLDNILCSEDLRQVKLCDFGSAFFETDTDNVPTPYLVSRFYRAPEIMLGQTYDHNIDLWSVGVSAYELFTGHVMFPGRSNNEMLKLMMAVKGRFPNKQIKMHLRQFESIGIADTHFDNDLRFKQYEMDPVTGKVIMRLVEITKPTKDLTSILRSSKAGADDGRLVSSFTHLLDQCLTLDPTKRISVQDALKHPFFSIK